MSLASAYIWRKGVNVRDHEDGLKTRPVFIRNTGKGGYPEGFNCENENAN